MTEPILFTSRSRIIAGRLAELEPAFAAAVDVIRGSKPRTAFFSAYVDALGTEVKIVHLFPDAAGMVAHFEGSEERTRSVAELIVPTDFAVYGPAPAGAIEQLGREAQAAGGSVEIFPRAIGGFLRSS